MTVQIAEFPENKSLGRHVNAASRKSLEIQACCIRKRLKSTLELKFV